MKNDLAVSVMITYYNQKQYIGDSLGSVLSQETTFPVEIICGDDGSDDGTYEELLSWRDRYPDIIRVIRMPREADKKYEPIVRVSYNRYTMWQQAKGKYISFLDGDDYFTDPHKLQTQAELLEEHPECSCCCQPVMMVWDDEPDKNQEMYGSRISDSVCVVSGIDYWTHFFCHADTFLFRNTYAVKQENVNKYFFDDYIIDCYFIKQGALIYSPDNMTAYRQVEDSSWNRRSYLRKCISNTAVYYEAKRILGGNPVWGVACYVRNIADLRELYENRGHIDLSAEDRVITDIICRHSFVRATVDYDNYGLLKKLRYQFRYFVPMHLCRLVLFYHHAWHKYKTWQGGMYGK